ncbi:MAG: glycosyltransferase family A protein [Phycisphaeraceae bacterium]
MSNLPKIRVAIFAHNEEQKIERSLTHVLCELDSFEDAQIRVLINGCTDNTNKVVAGMVEKYDGRIAAYEYKLGDKAATWNRYLYEVSEKDADETIQIFMDGDIWPEPGSILKMALALGEMPNVSVIGGLPMCGRNQDRYRRLAVDKHLIYGGIYATRGAWLSWARGVGFRIPAGLIADDAVLTNAFTTLPNDLRKSNLQRVHHLSDCGYRFTPIRPWRLKDLRLYLRRMVRYRLADEQLRVMGWRWPDEMPENVDAVNQSVLADLKQSGRRMSLVDYRLRKELEQRYGRGAA